MRREAALHLNSILYQNYRICTQVMCGSYAKPRTFSNQSVIGSDKKKIKYTNARVVVSIPSTRIHCSGGASTCVSGAHTSNRLPIRLKYAQVRRCRDEGLATTIGVDGSDLVRVHERDLLTVRRPCGASTTNGE